MVWHDNCFMTASEYKDEYRKRVREWARQVAYERGIVRSVPERSIEAISVLCDNDERWKPG